MKNKKAEQMISVYWFVILILVAVGIYAMIAAYFNYPTDVRQWEAEVLGNRVADCISENGKIVQELNEEFKSNFLIICGLNLEAQKLEQPQFYIEVNFFNVENLEESIFNFSKGNYAWKEQYFLQEEGKFQRVVKGSEKRFYSVDNQGKQILVEVLTVVRKTEKNVKI